MKKCISPNSEKCRMEYQLEDYQCQEVTHKFISINLFQNELNLF